MVLSSALLYRDALALVVNAPPAATVDPLAALVPLVRQGDRAATGRLLEALAGTVRQVVGATLGRAHPDHDDIAQECLVAITRALAQFRGECKVRHYAARIAVRVAREARARVRRVNQRHEPLDDDAEATTEAPDEDRSRARRAALWERLLAALPAEQAEAMVLRVVLDWELDEIAAATEAPVNTVRSRVRLAREALRAQLERNPRYAEILEAPR